MDPVTEETPLIQCPHNHEDVYNRFSPARKKVILGLVSLTGVLPLFVSGSFVPLIPQIARDMQSTAAVVSLAVSISVFATSIGSLLASSYSTFYGRRPIYMVGIPVLCISSLGVAWSKTIPQLLFWRFMQAMGSSPGLTIGTAVIGDIYKLEERGTALGLFFGAILVGPTIAPIAGGLSAYYFSWRILQLQVGVFALAALAFTFLFFPETYHPGERGVDKLDPSLHPKWRPVLINPLRPLWLLRSPNFLFVTFHGCLAIMTFYVVLIPIAYTIGKKYGITNEIVIGACILPCGLGNFAGAMIVGRFSDKMVKRWRKKRGGVWYPEDRLRAAMPGALFLTPLSVLLSGFIMENIPGRNGLALSLVCFFFTGVGVDAVLGPSAAYFVDALHSRSAEALAANSGFRQILTSFAIPVIIPMIETYGVGVTNTLAAVMAWVGCLLLWITICYGDQLRAVIDIGYSAQN